jgi:hypothetical protein
MSVHLPSSDPDFEEYTQFGSVPEVCQRRARRVATTQLPFPFAERDGIRFFRGQYPAWGLLNSNARQLQKENYPTNKEYDDAMDTVLHYGRRVVGGKPVVHPECGVPHMCRSCYEPFFCGFLAVPLGCPYDVESFGHLYNVSWGFQKRFCNHCRGWAKWLTQYYPPRDCNRRRSSLCVWNQDEMEDIMKERTDEMVEAASVVLLVVKQRQHRNDLAFMRRRANNLHRRGLPWPAHCYETYEEKYTIPHESGMK